MCLNALRDAKREDVAAQSRLDGNVLHFWINTVKLESRGFWFMGVRGLSFQRFLLTFPSSFLFSPACCQSVGAFSICADFHAACQNTYCHLGYSWGLLEKHPPCNTRGKDISLSNPPKMSLGLSQQHSCGGHCSYCQPTHNIRSYLLPQFLHAATK